MNICYIAKSYVPSRGANSIHAMKMCSAYASLGHRVTLVLPDWQEGIESDVEDVFAFYGVAPKFEIRKVPLAHWRSLGFLHHALLMPLVARSKQPVLVHSRGLTAAWGLTTLFRMPTIFETHQPISPNQHMQKMFRRLTKSPYLQALVFVTRALADYMRPIIPETARFLVAPDGVEADWLQRSMSPSDARNKLGLREEMRCIAVYTGNLFCGRGIELIIELARNLPKHLFIVVGGRGSDIAHYRQQTGELSNLKFVGFKPPAQVFTYLQAADVLLMPHSHRVETSGGGDMAAFTSPMKMFEYMAAGRPIVASTLPVLQEVLQDGVNAMLLPYDQPQRWVETLQRLQHDTDLAEKLGNRARGDVRQYTWENRAQRLLEQVGC